jgi:hypothetical protein
MTERKKEKTTEGRKKRKNNNNNSRVYLFKIKLSYIFPLSIHPLSHCTVIER